MSGFRFQLFIAQHYPLQNLDKFFIFSGSGHKSGRQLQGPDPALPGIGLRHNENNDKILKLIPQIQKFIEFFGIIRKKNDNVATAQLETQGIIETTSPGNSGKIKKSDFPPQDPKKIIGLLRG